MAQGVIRISTSLIGDLLLLPEGFKTLAIATSEHEALNGECSILVESDAIPESEAGLTEVTPRYRVVFHETKTKQVREPEITSITYRTTSSETRTTYFLDNEPAVEV